MNASVIVLVTDFGALTTTALSVISIATLAGLGLLRGTVTNLRENLKDARDEIADKERRMTEMEKTITRQDGDVLTLTRAVTGVAHWEDLNKQLNQHHETTIAQLNIITDQLAKIEQLKDEISRLEMQVRELKRP